MDGGTALIQVPAELLTPMIGIAVGYVAWQQWRLAEQRFKLDLYDRRIGLYTAAMELTSTILITATVTDEAGLDRARRLAPRT